MPKKRWKRQTRERRRKARGGFEDAVLQAILGLVSFVAGPGEKNKELSQRVSGLAGKGIGQREMRYSGRARP